MGLSPDDPVWDPTTFTKNRDRLQNGEVFTKFMTRLLNQPQVKPLLSDEHFSVDGTRTVGLTNKPRGRGAICRRTATSTSGQMASISRRASKTKSSASWC